MIEIKGNIWDFHKEGHYVAVTTNGVTKFGLAVMGKGIALQAKNRFPDLPKKLGESLHATGNFPHIFPEYQIITLPTKTVWWLRSDIKLIAYSCDFISKALNSPREAWTLRSEIPLGCLWDSVVQNTRLPLVIDKLYMTRPGCGNGHLDWETDVKPVIKNILDDRFVVVDNHIY